MNAASRRMPVLMIAYTNYRTDPRVIREAEAAVKGGFDVDFIALRRETDPPEESIRGVQVIHLDQQRYRGANKALYVLSYLEFFFRCLFKTTWLHLRKRYRVVHVNNMPDFFVFCAIVPKLMGAKVLLDIHDPMPNTFASKFRSGEGGMLYRLLLWQERLCAWFADQVVTVHEPVKAYILVEQHGLRADSVEVIANFADDELFRLRQPAPLDGRLRLVFHGSILERYGLRDLMQSIARMRFKDRISVKIIGEGDFSATLKDLISTLDLGGVVEFDNRMYPLHDIPAMLQGYHVGLVPLEISSITNYALPLKLLEYLSLGIPSITVRSIAIGHYFGSDDCLFYRPDEPETLTAVLDQLAESPDVVQRYQARAAAIRDRFVWSGEQRKYIALLHSLANPA